MKIASIGLLRQHLRAARRRRCVDRALAAVKRCRGCGRYRGRFGALTLCDTWRINSVFLKYETPSAYTDLRKENLRAKDFMQSDGALFRILPLPDHHILNQAGLGLEGIPSITGFNNLTVGTLRSRAA